MTEKFIQFLDKIAKTTSVSVFAFLGSIIDEIIAIIPSPLVPLGAGVLAMEQGKPFSFLFLVAFFGTLGKTLASYLTYLIADKTEDFFTTSKWGKIMGLDKQELEKYGKHFNGTSRDEVIMVILRSLPFMPTFPVSVLAGLIKIKPISFLATTFIGIYIRFMFYLIVAYKGIERYEGILGLFDSMNRIFEILMVGSFVVWLFLFFRRNGDRIMKRFKKMNQKN